MAHQVGGKDKRAVEHGQEQWFLVCQIARELSGHFIDATDDFFLLYIYLEILVFYLNTIHTGTDFLDLVQNYIFFEDYEDVMGK